MKKALLVLLFSTACVLSTFATGIVLDRNYAQIDCTTQVFRVLQKPSHTDIDWESSENVMIFRKSQDSVCAEFDTSSHYEGEPYVVAVAKIQPANLVVATDTIHLYTDFLRGITLTCTGCQYSRIGNQYRKQYAFHVETDGPADLRYFWMNTDSVSGHSGFLQTSSCTMLTDATVLPPGMYTSCIKHIQIMGGTQPDNTYASARSLTPIPYENIPLFYAAGDKTSVVVTLPFGTSYIGKITVIVRDNCCHEFEASKIITNQTHYIEQESWY